MTLRVNLDTEISQMQLIQSLTHALLETFVMMMVPPTIEDPISVIDDVVDEVSSVVSNVDVYTWIWLFCGVAVIVALILMQCARQHHSYDTDYEGECFPSDLLYLVISTIDLITDGAFLHEFGRFYPITNTILLMCILTFVATCLLNMVVVIWVIARKSRIPEIEKRWYRVGKNSFFFFLLHS
eukprot:TRINITY_DN5581_c0_g1_i1.p1 TRINITY_DN5581_c0_g1~~TRINITY_DN5581_c0_g1_i1.p1  ORF type:complete len:183 (+),score=13.26 TRINITY_DN5581_c0_g1_i1:56-604(+)